MSTDTQSIYFGCAYYPEHWPEDRWIADIILMNAAGFNVVRMGEFAWSSLEPEQGDYQFDWLEQVIAMLADAGIETVLGTPTAAPPAWLVQAHPDILPIDQEGRRSQFGNRTHYCVNSPQYHAAVSGIVAAMGRHFGQNLSVIGWQLDNEYSRICYCDRCKQRFHDWLHKKFVTLENLNARWTTTYWSQTYSEWEQIPIPIGTHNPGLMLAFRQFVSDSYRDYQKLQLDALRPQLREGVWVAHNFMNWFDRYDHYALSKDLDVVSWDWYVGSGHFDYTVTGAMHDLVRGYKDRNFWLMETQPGSVNWAPISNALNLGEARLMAWHAIAHGADAVLYWQWRSALNGQEQYHGSLIDQSGQPRPFYSEAEWLGGELGRVGPLLAGSVPTSNVAIINDFESRWSIQAQPHHHDFDYVEHLMTYYQPLARMNIGTDIIGPETLLRPYHLVIAPALIVMYPDRAEKLQDYVKRGGYLVLTPRTGMKDEYNALLASRQPGPLAEIAGVEVEEYYALEKPVPVDGNWFSGEAQIWAERLRIMAEHTIVIARYGPANGWLDDQVAITVHPFGRGMVYYVGAYLDAQAIYAMLERILRTPAGIKPPWEVPEGVELRQRTTGDKQAIYIMMNHNLTQQSIPVPGPMYDHISQGVIEEALDLIPYGVAVLTAQG